MRETHACIPEVARRLCECQNALFPVDWRLGGKFRPRFHTSSARPCFVHHGIPQGVLSASLFPACFWTGNWKCARNLKVIWETKTILHLLSDVLSKEELQEIGVLEDLQVNVSFIVMRNPLRSIFELELTVRLRHTVTFYGSACLFCPHKRCAKVIWTYRRIRLLAVHVCYSYDGHGSMKVTMRNVSTLLKETACRGGTAMLEGTVQETIEHLSTAEVGLAKHGQNLAGMSRAWGEGSDSKPNQFPSSKAHTRRFVSCLSTWVSGLRNTGMSIELCTTWWLESSY